MSLMYHDKLIIKYAYEWNYTIYTCRYSLCIHTSYYFIQPESQQRISQAILHFRSAKCRDFRKALCRLHYMYRRILVAKIRFTLKFSRLPLVIFSP